MMIYLPAVLPTLVVALIFRSILHPGSGLLNETLRAVGLDGVALRWLVDPAIALYSVIGVDTWKGVGYIMVILLAGLQTIPKDYYEAASIDGASALHRFWYVTIPLLMPAIVVISVLNILYGLRVFDIVYAMTNEQPGYADRGDRHRHLQGVLAGLLRPRNSDLVGAVPDPSGRGLLRHPSSRAEQR